MSIKKLLTSADLAAMANRVGANFALPLLRLAEHSDEGAELVSHFLAVASRAHLAGSEQSLQAFDRAADLLDAYARKAVHGDELKALQGEIQQQSNVIAFRASSAGAPMPESARFRSIMREADRGALIVLSARYQGVFVDHLQKLLKGEAKPSDLLAATTYQRMLAVVGNQAEDGWSRVFDYCAQNAQAMAARSRALRDVEERAVQLAPGSHALDPELRQARERFGGNLYPIRGELAEIYLHHWPSWRLERSSLLEIAAQIARKRLPRGWKPVPFSAGALIDGKKAWDEGVLLVKPPSPEDRIQRAALFAAAQVKVEKRVTALLQIINDRAREVGTGARPTLTLFEGNTKRDFVLEALPPDIEVIRYVFNAQGGKLSLRDVALLQQHGLRAVPRELDISIEGFEALARFIADTAPEYLAKLGTAP
jgi:hypothetical protein